MQKAYITALYDIMCEDPRVVSVLSDSGTDYDEMMAREMPDQVLNVGIAEQNQVSVAAGMAMVGAIPFVYTSGAFLAFRALESIRNDVCYQRQNVKVVGMGSGTSWCTLGPSHHTTEDLAALRAIPGLVVLSASTPLMASELVRVAYGHEGPVYLRLGMSGEAEYYEGAAPAVVGGSNVVAEGADVCILSTGSVLEEAMRARELLVGKGVSTRVVDMYSVKPIDAARVRECAGRFDAIVTVEEHSVSGGLGGAVAEVILEDGLGVRLHRIGMRDVFAKGYGTQLEVRQQNGLDGQSIATEVEGFLRRIG